MVATICIRSNRQAEITLHVFDICCLAWILSRVIWCGYYFYALFRYYLSFLSTVPLNECGRTVRRNLRPLFLPGSKLQAFKPLYDILGVLVSKVLMDYMFLSFFLRRFDYSITVWRNFYFFGHFMIIIPILALEWLKVKTILHPKKQWSLIIMVTMATFILYWYFPISFH